MDYMAGFVFMGHVTAESLHYTHEMYSYTLNTRLNNRLKSYVNKSQKRAALCVSEPEGVRHRKDNDSDDERTK